MMACQGKHDSAIAQYLAGLASLCMEVSRKPKLLPVFLTILKLVPRTVRELQRSRRLAA